MLSKVGMSFPKNILLFSKIPLEMYCTQSYLKWLCGLKSIIYIISTNLTPIWINETFKTIGPLFVNLKDQMKYLYQFRNQYDHHLRKKSPYEISDGWDSITIRGFYCAMKHLTGIEEFAITYWRYSYVNYFINCIYFSRLNVYCFY